MARSVIELASRRALVPLLSSRLKEASSTEGRQLGHNANNAEHVRTSCGCTELLSLDVTLNDLESTSFRAPLLSPHRLFRLLAMRFTSIGLYLAPAKDTAMIAPLLTHAKWCCAVKKRALEIAQFETTAQRIIRLKSEQAKTENKSVLK